MNDIGIDPVIPNKMFAATYTGDGLFVTEDGGSSWQAVEMENEPEYGAFKNHCVFSIKIAPSDNNVIWAVTDSKGAEGVFGGNLFISGDGGENWWEIFSLTPHEGRFNAVAVKPDDSNTVFTASRGREGSDYNLGIIKHYWDGISWNHVQPYDSINVRDISFDPQNYDTLYASLSKSIKRSDDGGETCQTYEHDNFFKSIAVHPTNRDVIFGGDLYLGIYIRCV